MRLFCFWIFSAGLLASVPSNFVGIGVNAATGSFNCERSFFEIGGPAPLKAAWSSISGPRCSSSGYDSLDMLVVDASCVRGIDFLKEGLGLSNAVSGELSARSHYKNTTDVFDAKSRSIVRTRPDGSKAIYRDHELVRDGFCLSGSCVLAEETLPNGCHIVYESQANASHYLRATAYAPDRKTRLGWIDTEHGCDSEGHSGKTDLEPPLVTTKVKGFHNLIESVSSPGGIKIFNEYYQAGKHQTGFGVIKCSSGDYQENRIKAQWTPAGKNGALVKVFEYAHGAYKSKADDRNAWPSFVQILDARGLLTQMNFNASKLLTSVEASHQGKRLRSEHYFWTGRDLRGQTSCNEKGECLTGTTYSYDERGNVLCETFYGSLTGLRQQDLEVDASGLPTAFNESYSKRYVYSNDGFNLLLESSEDAGRLVKYCYKPGTNLLTAKLLYSQGRLVMRYFYTYNELCLLVGESEDDGCSEEAGDLSGVTYRLLAESEYANTNGPVYLPSKTRKLHWDLASGKIVCDQTKTFFYDDKGRCKREETWDAEGKFCFAEESTYDGRQLLSRKDACGNLTSFEYDADDRCILQVGPEAHVTRSFSYDKAGRLVTMTVKEADGTETVASFAYNEAGDRITTTDPYHKTNDCQYDVFGRLLSQDLPKTHFAYDSHGNVTEMENADGEVIRTSYNARKEPIQRTFNDGSCERRFYNKDGSLRCEISRFGQRLEYVYDDLGRCIRETRTASSGAIIEDTRSTFKGKLLIEKSTLTQTETFSYNSAAQLLAKTTEYTKDGSTYTESYQYDALGRQCAVSLGDLGWKKKSFDACGRVVEEWTENTAGKVLAKVGYSYDAAGNQTELRQYAGSDVFCTRTTYDAQMRPYNIWNALGHLTTVRYQSVDEADGSALLQTVTTDPLGYQLITYQNKLGHVVRKKRLSPDGRLLKLQDIAYDAAGRRVEQTDHLIQDGLSVDTYAVRWTLGPDGRLEQVAEHSKGQMRLSSYFYDKVGRLQSRIKPDGVELLYSYDGKDRLRSLMSSDGSVSIRMERDIAGHIVALHGDELTLLREVDGRGLCTEESWSTGQKLSMSYDVLGRLTKVDVGGRLATYDYDVAYLRKASWPGVYSQDFCSYDERGLRLKASDSFGYSDECRYDGLSRLLDAPGFAIGEGGYDAAGNLLAISHKDGLGGKGSHYAYSENYEVQAESGLEERFYQYDSLGNRTQNAEIGAFNELLRQGDTECSYDACGRLVQMGAVQISYDALDRVTRIGSTTYLCDPLGRCVQQQVAGEKDALDLFYVGYKEVGAKRAGCFVQLRLLDPTQTSEAGATLLLELGGQLYKPFADSRGSVALLEQVRGKARECYRYSAFGELRIFDGAGKELASSAFGNPYFFNGKRLTQKQFYHFGKRTYCPELGRWLSPDPAGYTDGCNLYAYVHNAPFTYIDEFGLWSVSGAIDSMTDSLYEGQRKVRKFVGSKMIAAFGHHFVPVPGVRDVIEKFGNFVHLGSEGWNKKCRYRDFDSAWHKVGEHKGEKSIHISFSGMFNKESSIHQLALQHSEELGGLEVYYYKQHSMGFALDALRAAGFIATDKRDIEQISSRLSELGKEAAVSQRSLCIRAHSAGTRTLHEGLQECSADTKSVMDIHAFGGAKILSDSACRSVNNYVVRTDWVPGLGDPIAYIKAVASRMLGYPSLVQFLRGSRVPFRDHAIDSDPYKSIWMQFDRPVVKPTASL